MTWQTIALIFIALTPISAILGLLVGLVIGRTFYPRPTPYPPEVIILPRVPTDERKAIIGAMRRGGCRLLQAREPTTNVWELWFEAPTRPQRSVTL